MNTRDINDISQTISEYRYDVRKVSNPDACPCYSNNIRCHNLENLNCMLCYCPFYDMDKLEGGCLRKSPQGKWYEHSRLPKGKIWDCSDCNYPHIEENVLEYMLKNIMLNDLNDGEKNLNIKENIKEENGMISK